MMQIINNDANKQMQLCKKTSEIMQIINNDANKQEKWCKYILALGYRQVKLCE